MPADQLHSQYLFEHAPALNPNMQQGREARTSAVLSIRNTPSQFELDVAMWYGTLTYGTPWKVRMLRRIFAVLEHGGLMFRSRGMWRAFSGQNAIPLAAVFSHGGRVLIQLPQNDGNNFWDWLWGGEKPQKRLGATHGMFFGEPVQALPYGFTKRITEVGNKGEGKHYGVNVGCGGVGAINPYSGVRIAEDGEHGHLYLCYVAPTANRVGGILIGVEDSAPIDRARFLAPGHRTHFFAVGQTGHKHTFGAAGTYSCTGGEKWQTIARRPSAPADGPWYKQDTFFVDLSGGYAHLVNTPATHRFDDLERLLAQGALPPNPPAPGAPAATRGNLPIPEVWKVHSKDLAKDIDKDVSGMGYYQARYNNICAQLDAYDTAMQALDANAAALAKNQVQAECQGFINDRANHFYPYRHFLLIEDLFTRAQ